MNISVLAFAIVHIVGMINGIISYKEYSTNNILYVISIAMLAIILTQSLSQINSIDIVHIKNILIYFLSYIIMHKFLTIHAFLDERILYCISERLYLIILILIPLLFKNMKAVFDYILGFIVSCTVIYFNNSYIVLFIISALLICGLVVSIKCNNRNSVILISAIALILIISFENNILLPIFIPLEALILLNNDLKNRQYLSL